MKKLLLLAFVAGLTFSSCKKDETPEEEQTPAVTSGMVVGCEGTFGLVNSSVHFIYDDARVANNVFEGANNVGPGDVMQQFRIYNGFGYAVMNNSQKVEVVRASDFSFQGSITGCDYPRDVMVLNDSKGYISNGSGAGELLIFNPTTRAITGSVTVGDGPEQIAYNGTHVFVANSGGWGFDNSVSVVDPLTDQVVATVEVGDRPVALEVDYQNNVWVLCKGDIEYDENWNIVNETQATLHRIDGTQFVQTGVLNIGEIGEHPEFMDINGAANKLYIENDEIVVLSIVTGEFEADLTTGSFFGIGVHPTTGEVYLGSAPDYTGNDQVFVYSADGTQLETYDVGIATRSFAFRN
ncbi:YncE family protein [Sanyastnella coralliicola]|uniref:YncE family protein n=1 Tax=Sanyastnella coralliicola TaxID=3069118 RepID=UPI0027BA9E31|nr:DUF5074 domain-containing protein [Longitalea sp. SCSIO 12813]